MRNLELGQLNHILAIEHAKLDVLSIIALSVNPDLPSFRESALSTNIFFGLSKDTNCFPMSPTWGAVPVHSMAINTAYSWAPKELRMSSRDAEESVQGLGVGRGPDKDRAPNLISVIALWPERTRQPQRRVHLHNLHDVKNQLRSVREMFGTGEDEALTLHSVPRYLTVFSPEGRLYQVGTSVAWKCSIQSPRCQSNLLNRICFQGYIRLRAHCHLCSRQGYRYRHYSEESAGTSHLAITERRERR